MIALKLFGGIACVVFVGWMLTDKVSRRVRNSRYWFVGWTAYMLAILMATELLLPFYYGPSLDEKYIPLVLGVLIALIWVAVGYQLYRIRHPRKKKG